MSKDKDLVSCAVKLPRKIWRGARKRAIDEQRTFQALVSEAIALYLKTKRDGTEGKTDERA